MWYMDVHRSYIPVKEWFMKAQPIPAQAQFLESLERFVDADAAAAFVGITRRTLLQKVRAGKIPGYPLDRGAKKKEWRFKLSELDRYLCTAINSVLQPPEPANRRI
jgi:excisionase family DNA binding protein